MSAPTRPGAADAADDKPRGVDAPGRATIKARTLRKDQWWRSPLITMILLTVWVLYALIRTMSQKYYFVVDYHYLSPFSSPCVSASCVPESRDFGTWFGEFPPFVPFAILVLPFLLGFRLDLLLLPQGLLPGVLALARRPARCPSHTRSTPARPASRWSSRTATATSSTRRSWCR